MSDTFNDLLAGNAPAFKFETIGDTCKGRVVSAEQRQQTDADTGKPRFFDEPTNLRPMMQLVVTVEQDDGTETTLYFKGGKFAAVEGRGASALDALRAAVGTQEFRVGGTLAVQFSGLGEKKGVKSAPKLYTVQYKAPAISLDDSLI